MRQNPGVQGLCAMRVGSECEEGYCTQNLLQVMDRSDIALWVPMAAQNQRLQSEMLCLRVCEWKSELGESLKLISLDPRSGWEWVRRQRRCAMRATVLFQTQWRCYTQILWKSVNFLGSESGKIHWISHSSHFTGQTVSFYLTLQFIQQLLQLVDLRAPVLVPHVDLWKNKYISRYFNSCLI